MRNRPAIVLAVLAAGLFGLAPPGHAATTTDACGDSAPAKRLLASADIQQERPTEAAVQAMAEYKARNDTEATTLRSLGSADAATAHEATKAAHATPPGKAVTTLSTDEALRACAEGRPLPQYAPDYTSGPGYAWVDYLNQQGQWTSYYCGPATVSEMALTVPGPSWVDQGGAASYMGTNGDGTSVGQLVSGLNHFVGVPNYGYNFYAYVWMDYNPTAQQRADFLARLQYDVTVNTPVAGNAWEVAGGPHLIGHPAGQTIFHWFEIGGWSTNSSQVYYADSATTVWSSVPAYSWQNTYTVATIMGGRGYAW